MEEYLNQLLQYLPIQFSDEDANEFVTYLSETYLENLEKEKYQFAFTAFHMLNMVFVYKIKWLLKNQNNSDIITSLNNYIQSHRGTVFNTFFDLSLVSEKKSLEILLRSLRFHANDIGICKNHVDVRDNCSHASGRIYYKTPSRIESVIDEKIEFIQKIQKKIHPEIKKLLVNYLENNWAPPIQLGYIKSWIISNYFSQEDLKLITSIDLPLFKKKSNDEKEIYQKILYLYLLFEIQNQINIDKNLFLEKLPIFMIGLPKSIKIKKGDHEEKISTNDIIETFLMPIISSFSKEERIKSEKILKLKK